MKSVADVEKCTGLSRTTLTHFYYERSNPNLSTLTSIAEYLEVTLDELVPLEQMVN